MKPLKYLFFALVALVAAACSDDDKGPDFEILTYGDLEFEMKGGEELFLLASPGAWSIESQPEWCRLYPDHGQGSHEVKLVCDGNEGKIRRGEIVLVCGREKQTLSFRQDGIVVMGFPVEWLFTAEYYASGKYTSAFVDDNLLPAESGKGYISFIQDPANAGSATIKKVIGATGHPYLSGTLIGDYWLFRVPVEQEELPAGSRINIRYQTRSAKTAARYWTLEYYEAKTAKWETIGTERQTVVAGEGNVSYTIDLVEDLTGNKQVGTDNAQIDETFTLSAAIPVGKELQVRMRLVSNIDTSGTIPSKGNNRLAGAEGSSPVIKVLASED